MRGTNSNEAANRTLQAVMPPTCGVPLATILLSGRATSVNFKVLCFCCYRFSAN